MGVSWLGAVVLREIVDVCFGTVGTPRRVEYRVVLLCEKSKVLSIRFIS